MEYKDYGTYSQGSIWGGIKDSFRKGSALIKLIYINIGLFLVLRIANTLLLMGQGQDFRDTLLEYLAVPAYPEFLLYKPWTVITYMFTQFDFLHLLFNMLWLYWFGSLFLNYFSAKRLAGVYLLGGLSGALLYILAYNTIPAFHMVRYTSWAIGASASVMAIVFAVCTYLPNYKIYVFLIGPVKLIYLALFTAAIDIISIPTGNAGGHIAHLGGALFGYLFILGIRRNKDITQRVTSLPDKVRSWFAPRPKMRVKHKKRPSEMNDQEYNQYKKESNEQINTILDKISRSGYESLTQEEKELLFKSGK